MSAPAAVPTIYFYRKRGCHLCDDMARALVEFRRELDSRADSNIRYKIIERDIEDDARWHRRYREYIPTLVIGRREVCHYFLDKDELRAALACR